MQTHQVLGLSSDVRKINPISILQRNEEYKSQLHLSFCEPNKQGISIRGITYTYQDSEIFEHISGAIVSYDDAECFDIIINYNDITDLTYGKWRRIDDFVTDALLSVPEIVFEKKLYTIHIIGGWLQGKWEEKLYRRFSAGTDSLEPYDIEKIVSDAIIYPLDIEHPMEWSYIPNQNTDLTKPLEYKKDDKSGFLYLDITELNEHLEQTPCLLRDDKKAIISKTNILKFLTRDEETVSNPLFTYLDESIFFSFSVQTYGGINIATCGHYGFTTLPPPKEFWPCEKVGKYGSLSFTPQLEGSFLSYRNWSNFLNTLLIAWPSYKGILKEKGYAEPVSGLEYLQIYPLKLCGGFTAGISNSTYEVYISSIGSPKQ